MMSKSPIIQKSNKIPGNNTRPIQDPGNLMDTLSGWASDLTAKLRLSSSEYRQFRSVVLPVASGSVRIDLVIVSPYGVFMCEKKRMKGQIFGGKTEKTWVQQVHERKRTFNSPLPQIYGHAALLAAKLGIDAGKVFPVLVFAGGSFATKMPPQVTKAGGYVRYVKSKTIPVLARSDVARINERLASGLLPDPAAAGKQPAKQSPKAAAPGVAKKKTCPRCGSTMMLRTVTKGAKAGKKFWLCSSYPQCKAAFAFSARPRSTSDFGPPIM